MSEIKKVKVSELAELTDPKGYWMFGYKTENNKHVSKRVSWDKLVKVVEDAAKSVQLERRIIVAFERPEQLIPIGEKMRVYKVAARNIKRLQYRLNQTGSMWADLKEGVLLDGTQDIVVKIESDQQNVGYSASEDNPYEGYSTLTIFAKIVK